eukprot:CAMPEP_0179078092 /NCGR_PEP_ID=MMETSP0796-20121207/34947_1 /TAXON_ID=73915 /ORGANISM="Pyrodinium bahamense, Strain pbaha01" /LENGTH=226 /DNA_ID=CAMNT_0020775383 /DNA_START=94 /DNA_END=775 /DNA_ORIENTATION=+
MEASFDILERTLRESVANAERHISMKRAESMEVRTELEQLLSEREQLRAEVKRLRSEVEKERERMAKANLDTQRGWWACCMCPTRIIEGMGATPSKSYQEVLLNGNTGEWETARVATTLRFTSPSPSPARTPPTGKRRGGSTTPPLCIADNSSNGNVFTTRMPQGLSGTLGNGATHPSALRRLGSVAPSGAEDRLDAPGERRPQRRAAGLPPGGKMKRSAPHAPCL